MIGTEAAIITDLWVPGRPKPKGSLKNVARAGRPVRLVEEVAGSAEWKRRVRNAVVRHLKASDADPLPLARVAGLFPITAAVEVTVRFRFDPPGDPVNRLYPCGLEGDTDKLCRNVGDALQESGLIKDDRLIVRWDAEKSWTMGTTEGLSLSVRIAP